MNGRRTTVLQVMTRWGLLSAASALSVASCGGKALLDDEQGRGGMSSAHAGSAGLSSDGSYVSFGGALGIAGAPIAIGGSPPGGFAAGGAMSTAGGVSNGSCQSDDECAPYRCAEHGCLNYCDDTSDCRNGFCQAGHCHELAVSVSVGLYLSCAVLVHNGVRCWGANDVGQLGHDGPSSTQPVEVPGVQASGVAVGERFACALGMTGSVECWGLGTKGQLGHGANQTSSAPQNVVGLEEAPAAQLVAGQAHACVLSTNGGVHCWGDNTRGQLGNATRSSSPFPVTVALGGGLPVRQLVAGARHNCVLLDDASVRCWGAGQLGELGVPDLIDGLVPVQVQGLPGAENPVVGLSAGGDHTCAILADSRVVCWGADTAGQLGDGVSQPYSTYPTPVLGLPVGGDPLVQFVAGDDADCVSLGVSGRVRCLGGNQWGQLGDGTLTRSLDFVTALGFGPPPRVSVLAMGPEHVCATLTDGSIVCWGDNSAGELGSYTGDKFSAVATAVLGW